MLQTMLWNTIYIHTCSCCTARALTVADTRVALITLMHIYICRGVAYVACYLCCCVMLHMRTSSILHMIVQWCSLKMPVHPSYSKSYNRKRCAHTHSMYVCMIYVGTTCKIIPTCTNLCVKTPTNTHTHVNLLLIYMHMKKKNHLNMYKSVCQNTYKHTHMSICLLHICIWLYVYTQISPLPSYTYPPPP